MKHTIGILGGWDLRQRRICWKNLLNCDMPVVINNTSRSLSALSLIFPIVQHVCYPAGLRHTVIWSVICICWKTPGRSVSLSHATLRIIGLMIYRTVAKARMISILDATLGDIPPSARHVGLLATNATLATGLYQKKALARGLTLIQPEEAGQALVMQAIYTLKRGDKTAAQALLLPQIDSLIARGAQAIIMGCTEIPLIVAGHERAIACPMIDSTASLVRAAIRWYESWPDTRASLTGEQRLTA